MRERGMHVCVFVCVEGLNETTWGLEEGMQTAMASQD